MTESGRNAAHRQGKDEAGRTGPLRELSVR